MAYIQFFEKPGCINGGKQKNILLEAGNVLECVNILDHPWSAGELAPFLVSKEAVLIMNHTAPAIKSGEIDPTTLSYDEAIALMVENPILIKRPLIRVDGLSIQGFTDERLSPYLGAWDRTVDVTTCPNLLMISCDDQKKRDSNSVESKII